MIKQNSKAISEHKINMTQCSLAFKHVIIRCVGLYLHKSFVRLAEIEVELTVIATPRYKTFIYIYVEWVSTLIRRASPVAARRANLHSQNTTATFAYTYNC